jgi:very-short-patch-repair endonuclease
MPFPLFKGSLLPISSLSPHGERARVRGERMKHRARTLRKNMTDVERLLWGRLRDRQLGGYKFRRQHPIGPFFLDFVCLEKKLVIEVDGGQHAKNLDADVKRSNYLKERGYQVLRFWNNEVLEESQSVALSPQEWEERETWARISLKEEGLGEGGGNGEGAD